jgi:hypothetical protein
MFVTIPQLFRNLAHPLFSNLRSGNKINVEKFENFLLVAKHELLALLVTLVILMTKQCVLKLAFTSQPVEDALDYTYISPNVFHGFSLLFP